jgi:hypothetical protein
MEIESAVVGIGNCDGVVSLSGVYRRKSLLLAHCL